MSSEPRKRKVSCNEEGYQTPKVDVRGAVIEGGKILLVKEKLDGKWSMPGGWADIGLSAKENVVKEIHEEAGIEAEPMKLIAVLDRNKHNRPVSAHSIYKIFILCKHIDGDFVKNSETEESGWFTKFTVLSIMVISVKVNYKLNGH